MNRLKMILKRKLTLLSLLLGVCIFSILAISFDKLVKHSSTNSYCNSCHVHDHADKSWRLSAHSNNLHGIEVACVDCHLSPKGDGYLKTKAYHGMKDVYAYWFKDSSDYNWPGKRTLEKANTFTYEQSCKNCHQNLYSADLSKDGIDSHIYYENNAEEMTCLNCHMYTGHYNPDQQHKQNLNFGNTEEKEVNTEATKIHAFENFTEKIPGSSVSFNMIAIPGGEYLMGSPEDEAYRNQDEGPQRKIQISPFFMAELEVSWNEFLVWFSQTASEGRKEVKAKDIDAISGATPPWGAPDQGWGKGSRPAITMSHYAAVQYCRWLSLVTGKKYRLPTEAEWEYVARGGSTEAYSFGGNPKNYSELSFKNKVFGADTSTINTYAIYKENSKEMTQAPSMVKANQYGIKNMHGNVAEFCSDWYSPDAYTALSKETNIDPKGPKKGKEHVIRGGSFKSDASGLRSASRSKTQTTNWLKTDPQMPKSIWWYSDANHVGFRVICEIPEGIK